MNFVFQTTSVMPSPIGAAQELVVSRANVQPLLDLSQAAPSFPPAPEVIAKIAEVAEDPDGARYSPLAGLPTLREAFAAELDQAYGASLSASHVAITAGCNQAFCITVSALAEPGDSIVLVTPHYFNHDMWLKLQGIDARYLPAGTDGIPDPEQLESLVDDRTRAILLVSPGNPTGVIIPPEVIEKFADAADRLNIVLILDETYRVYRPTKAPAHGLFSREDWHEHFVSLHSFSKDLAIPGYRVGALVGSAQLIEQSTKILDCVAICAPRVGQEAVLAGLKHAALWRLEQVKRIGALERYFAASFSSNPGGFELITAGAYFGWVHHPFDNLESLQVIRKLLDHDVLAIPGTAFTIRDGGMLRFSFANLTTAEIDDLVTRLGSLK